MKKRLQQKRAKQFDQNQANEQQLRHGYIKQLVFLSDRLYQLKPLQTARLARQYLKHHPVSEIQAQDQGIFYYLPDFVNYVKQQH